MKYKIKSDMGKQAISHLVMGKYDWTIWSGEDRDQCVQIHGLFRDVVVYDKDHSNVIDRNGNRFREEQLVFQSRKAAARWIRKHKAWIVADYQKHCCRQNPYWVMAAQWHGKGVLYMDLLKIK